MSQFGVLDPNDNGRTIQMEEQIESERLLVLVAHWKRGSSTTTL